MSSNRSSPSLVRVVIIDSGARGKRHAILLVTLFSRVARRAPAILSGSPDVASGDRIEHDDAAIRGIVMAERES
jgi:hypothetical protein